MTQPRPLLIGSLLVIAVLFAYSPALRGGFIWDDDDYVTENVHLRTPSGLKRIWLDTQATPQYYPLVHTTFWLEYRLWQLNPYGYHFTNVVLHAASVLLLWRVLRKLEVQGAWLAAGVFALHPVHVESVAWITERKNVLSAVFYLAALLSYLKFYGAQSNRESVSGAKVFYVLCLVLFVCALLSKTITASLPAAILLIMWWKHGRILRRDVLLVLPMFLIAIPFCMLTAHLEEHQVGATGDEWNIPFVERCLIAGRVTWFYLGKLCLPRHLTFFYPRWEINAGSVWPYLYPLAMLCLVVFMWFRRHAWGRGPLVALLFFLGTLFPAMGFFNIYPMRYSFVADHFQYLASLGPLVLFAAVVTTFTIKLGWSRTLRISLAAILLLTLGYLCFRQSSVYANVFTLWNDTIRKNPLAWMAYNNLGREWFRRGDLVQAQNNFEQAILIKPDHIRARFNLARAFSDSGKLDQAVQQLQQALEISPKFAEARNSLGNLFAKQSRFEEASEQYELALKAKPDYAAARFNYGQLLADHGQFELAREQFNKTIEVAPRSAAARHRLAQLLTQIGDVPQAIQHLEKVLAIDPGHTAAKNQLAWLLATADKPEDRDPERALRLAWDAAGESDFNDAEILRTLAAALAATGKFKDAVHWAKQAVEMAPEDLKEEYRNRLKEYQARIAE